MSAHISEDLPRLLTGDATRAETLAAAEHLRGCPDCQQELVSAVVAHASLSSARRFAPEFVAARPTAADKELDAGADNEAPRLPDLSAIISSVSADESIARREGRGSRRRWLVAAAAAAVVVAGGGVTAAELVGSGGHSHSAAQSVRLRPVGDIRATATATISGGTMRVDATGLPQLNPARQYEVWLVGAGGTRLRPLGYVGEDRQATLAVPGPVMDRYTDIAISIQKTDQVQFSGDLVVRGHYA